MTTLQKTYVKNLDLSKNTSCRILVPHNNGNVKPIVVDGEQVMPHKLQTRMQE